MDLVKEVRAARRVSTPILAVTTANQQAVIATLAEKLNDKAPLVQWDHVHGLRAVNKAGEEALGVFEDLTQSRDPVTALEMSEELPEGTVLFYVNAHCYVADVPVNTGIGNLRDPFKSNNRTLILLGPGFTLPAELRQDIVLLTDPLPEDKEILEAAKKILTTAGAEFDEKILRGMMGAGRGLSTFGFEQQAYMSLRKDKETGKLIVDMDSLYERKIQAVNAVPGLTMTLPNLDPKNVSGLDAIMEFYKNIAAGPEAPGALVFMDEVDKKMGGVGYGGGGGGDSSGVSQDAFDQLLERMEDSEMTGALALGPPGTGKTFIVQTVASVLGVPFLKLDLGGTKASLVGDSERNIRMALDMIDRIGARRTTVMATCNRLEALPPEFIRRFTDGKWFFDIPKKVRPLFDIYCKKYGVEPPPDLKKFKGWTGAEVRNVCRMARRLSTTVEDASRYVVPVSITNKAEIARLRKLASGNFLDAARGGPYTAAERVETGSERMVREDGGWK